MKHQLPPQDQVLWYLNHTTTKPLTNTITADVVVIGGGMAGLSAAQACANKGANVVLLEKNYCGAGASGKSSGFITPDSEISLRDLITSRGIADARQFWEFMGNGVELIRRNIATYSLDCDYQEQDVLVVASSPKAFTSMMEPEHQARQQMGYASTLYTTEQLTSVIGSNGYYGGVSYGQTFGIQGYRYCQGMKQVLLEQNVAIYEETPALEIKDHYVATPNGAVKAKHIIVAIDHAVTQLGLLAQDVYHVQNSLMVSAPLSDAQIKRIFPHGNYMVWDTDLVFNFFRLTGDNRLMLGGGSMLYAYAQQARHDNRYMTNKLQSYFAKKFPGLNLQWNYMWPGIIGISKDVLPVAGHDKTMPSVYYIAAAAGLPIAATLGNYSAERIINNNRTFDAELSPYRSYKIGPIAQKLLGTRLTFALNNFLTVGSV